MQAENYQLRDYIISLQSRLLESQGEYPQPPSNININPQTARPPPEHRAPTASMRSHAHEELQASAAQAVAEHKQHDETYPNKGTRQPEEPEPQPRPPNGLPTSEYRPIPA